VDSAPRAYRLKASNACLSFSTFSGATPRPSLLCFGILQSGFRELGRKCRAQAQLTRRAGKSLAGPVAAGTGSSAQHLHFASQPRIKPEQSRAATSAAPAQRGNQECTPARSRPNRDTRHCGERWRTGPQKPPEGKSLNGYSHDNRVWLT